MRHPASRGYSLIELLVALGLTTVLIILCGTTYFGSQQYTRLISEGSREAMRALNAGEHWRTDVRWAVRPPVVTEHGLEIPQNTGTVRYLFRKNQVLRRVDGELDWTSVVSNVSSSSMIEDQRSRLVSWRWEVELQPKRKGLRPHRFSFLAVPMGVSKGDGNAR